jgi:MFS family permease
VYWAGGLLSNLGTWLQAVAGSIFVYQLTGSALAVGVLNFVGFLPILLFSLAGGQLSDRFDRRTIVIRTHLVSGTVATGLAILAFAGSASEVHVIVVAFALNTSYAIAKPSLISLVPNLVPRDEVTDAVGLNSLQFILGQIIGPTIAALVMATAGAGPAFAINAATYIGPIASMVYLQRRGLGGRKAAEMVGAVARSTAVSAVAYVREQRWVLALLIGVVSCSAPLEVIRTLAPAFVVEQLGESESAAGFIVTAQSVGSALALLIFVPLRRRGLSHQMAAAGLLVQAIGVIFTTVAHNMVAASFGVALVGFGFSLCFPILTGTLQAEVHDQVRGRVMALHQMFHLGNRPATALAVGVLATAFGAGPAVLSGIVLAPIGLMATRQAWRRMGAVVQAPGPGPDAAAEASQTAVGGDPPRSG